MKRILSLAAVGALLVWSLLWGGARQVSLAAAGSGYELTRSSLAAAISSAGGGFSLAASAGQASAGQSVGNGYSMQGGFWGGGGRQSGVGPYRMYVPLIRK